MEFMDELIMLPCEFFSLSQTAFVHVRPAQLCTENGDLHVQCCGSCMVSEKFSV